MEDEGTSTSATPEQLECRILKLRAVTHLLRKLCSLRECDNIVVELNCSALDLIAIIKQYFKYACETYGDISSTNLQFKLTNNYVKSLLRTFERLALREMKYNMNFI